MEIDEKIINEPYGFIYITTNMVNGKRYLGKRKFSNGWQRYLGSGVIFHKAVKLYGRENFSRNIIYICMSEEELNEAEYELSVFLNVVEDPNWYNVVYGGGSIHGYHLSEEQKQHLREVNLGRRQSEETRQKLRELFAGENAPWYGKHLPEDVKKKISDAAKNRTGEKNPFYKKQHTEESKLKMSEAKKDKQSIVQLTKDQNFIKEWKCIQQASDTLNITYRRILDCCKKRQQTTCGFCWMYANEYYTKYALNPNE